MNAGEDVDMSQTCNTCIHYHACQAWIRHGKVLYDDFDYSTENCPYYYYSDDSPRYWKWLIHEEPDRIMYKCPFCYTIFVFRRDGDHLAPNKCACCGAEVDGGL